MSRPNRPPCKTLNWLSCKEALRRRGSLTIWFNPVTADQTRWHVSDVSTLSRREKTLAVNIPYRGAQRPLHLLIDSIGIKGEGGGEWSTRKHGGPGRCVWRKIHIGADEETPGSAGG